MRTKDTGTLEIYFNSDFTECIVLERYRDSAALLEHFANLGSLTSEMFETCSAEPRAGEGAGRIRRPEHHALLVEMIRRRSRKICARTLPR